jgi:hypothetical protein
MFGRVFLLILLIIAPGLPPLAAQPSGNHPPLPNHPRLLLTGDQVDALRSRVQKLDWAKSIWSQVINRADRAIADAPEIPPRGSNWTHWYVCPDHGGPLKRGESTRPWQWKHECPEGHTVVGDPDTPNRDFDGCVIEGLHNALARDVRTLGLAFAVTGNRKYASRARDILLGYAAVYPDFPLHDRKGRKRVGGGRTTSQTLDEAIWLIALTEGMDLIWNTLSPEDVQTVRERLLLPAVRDVILPKKRGVHNIQCWQNSAVGLVGLLLGDRALIDAAIDDPHNGARKNLADGVLGEGIWWEGSWGYHFYALDGILHLTEAARNCGIVIDDDSLQKLFDGPTHFLQPDGDLPAFNDTDAVGLDLVRRNGMFGLAYARFANPAYLPILAQSAPHDEWALLYRPDRLPEGKQDAPGTANFPVTGYTVLRKSDRKHSLWLCLKYGPHGGGHGHPDKLGFILYADGERLAEDPGNIRYGSPLAEGWYKKTIAHNTLVIDGRDQREATGTCLGFGEVDGINYISADAGPIHRDVTFRRTVLMPQADTVVVVDQVTSDSEHNYRIVNHIPGTWKDSGNPASAESPNPYLEDVAARESSGTERFALGNQRRLTLIGTAPTRILTGTGPGLAGAVPAVLFEREASNTVFVWAITLEKKPIEIEIVPSHGEHGVPLDPWNTLGLVIQGPTGKRKMIMINPDGRLAKTVFRGGRTLESADIVSVYR